jgi:hypothetical protein
VSALDTIENEIAFRALNERIKELESDWRSADPMAFVCECATASCTAAVYMTVAEYDEVREEPSHLLVLPHHVDFEAEHVVRSTGRYAVVEKLEPDASGP